MAEKPTLGLVGTKDAAPTAEDLVALFTKITGKVPSKADIEELKRTMAEGS